ncbi:hypothetical protein DSL72_007729 [Monilinia vaccinii-corymbosi]|uniref:Uncharacterized protein n=1 Tax=Monilinia vaccinii-corymbosi TaxID=61207 RepID=A0A8A3PIG3_9HELO|nr:hypothetical protein DSL72_007729 [Monilinia vaccinii-corymbosi]
MEETNADLPVLKAHPHPHNPKKKAAHLDLAVVSHISKSSHHVVLQAIPSNTIYFSSSGIHVLTAITRYFTSHSQSAVNGQCLHTTYKLCMKMGPRTLEADLVDQQATTKRPPISKFERDANLLAASAPPPPPASGQPTTTTTRLNKTGRLLTSSRAHLTE